MLYDEKIQLDSAKYNVVFLIVKEYIDNRLQIKDMVEENVKLKKKRKRLVSENQRKVRSCVNTNVVVLENYSLNDILIGDNIGENSNAPIPLKIMSVEAKALLG